MRFLRTETGEYINPDCVVHAWVSRNYKNDGYTYHVGMGSIIVEGGEWDTREEAQAALDRLLRQLNEPLDA